MQYDQGRTLLALDAQRVTSVCGQARGILLSCVHATPATVRQTADRRRRSRFVTSRGSTSASSSAPLERSDVQCASQTGVWC